MLPDLRCNPLTPRGFCDGYKAGFVSPYRVAARECSPPERREPTPGAKRFMVRLRYVEGIWLSVRQDLSQVRYSAWRGRRA